ncbi:MAG TPA: hypothetical protein VLM40_10515, partial [Gemmata sp.]|nr:hypothetical protein [Gemmata sp.]
MKSRHQFRPQLESLGTRAMPSIVLSGGVLSVGGTAGADAIRVWSPSSGKLEVHISSTGEDRSFDLSEVHHINVGAGSGNDLVAIRSDVSIDATVRGGRGNDVINGGSGNDDLSGGRGSDIVRGRGGNDDVNGDDGSDMCDGGAGDDSCNGGNGNDDLNGGSGDDSLNGGSGRDGCNGGSGSDDVKNGMDEETELAANFTNGPGGAEFKFGPEDGGIEREFEVEVEDLTPNSTATVTVDGVNVGTINVNSFGSGKLKFSMEFDSDHDGRVDFPSNFPEIHEGSVIA